MTMLGNNDWLFHENEERKEREIIETIQGMVERLRIGESMSVSRTGHSEFTVTHTTARQDAAED